MFAQANSEHCRHKIFNAAFRVDGVPMPQTLFDMIRETYRRNATGILSAYRDNAAVIEGPVARRFFPDPATGRYGASLEPVDILMKVETHNHPTAIAPFAGAATGSGGEIRDEGATGRGAKPKAGLCGFSVSNLHIPGMPQPWEAPLCKPDRIASALEIMLAGPIGAAAFNNLTTLSKDRMERWRGIAGLTYKYEILYLGGQFAMDLEEPSAENANLGVSGSKQWTMSFEAGVSF